MGHGLPSPSASFSAETSAAASHLRRLSASSPFSPDNNQFSFTGLVSSLFTSLSQYDQNRSQVQVTAADPTAAATTRVDKRSGMKGRKDHSASEVPVRVGRRHCSNGLGGPSASNLENEGKGGRGYEVSRGIQSGNERT